MKSHSMLAGVQALGFDLRREDRRTCRYTHTPGSMLQTLYDCAFFVAAKGPVPQGQPH